MGGLTLSLKDLVLGFVCKNWLYSTAWVLCSIVKACLQVCSRQVKRAWASVFGILITLSCFYPNCATILLSLSPKMENGAHSRYPPLLIQPSSLGLEELCGLVGPGNAGGGWGPFYPKNAA